ncbi:hypothetical protein C0992_004760 [Termitomyces sp. T32_za158]|nr:hypothetical protein C0992_004760 [Termitomyces sp. T32_za158]
MKNCSSYCDMYENKSLLRRYLKSLIHEARLAEYASQFSEYETRIEKVLVMQASLDIQSERLDIMAQGIQEQFRSLFKQLDTPREKDIRQIIDSNGPRNSINNDQVLKRLLQVSGEDTSDHRGIGIETLDATKKNLIRELVEDVEETLRQSSSLLEGKLDILSRQMKDEKEELNNAIDRQGKHIVATLAGGYERIVDPQIQSIWKDMGWKSHAKARQFVLALRDSYLDKGVQTSDKETNGHDYDDEWTLSYFSISYLQAISEAIDDDGSGFITIQEVNAFTKSRPRDWSLLQWLAYWAAGWRSSISIYNTKIHLLLRKIYSLRAKIRLENRQALDLHLCERVFYQLELLLRSTRTLEEEIVISQDLERLRDQYTCQEEKRIHADLQRIAYTIDSSATVSLVTGQGRIERYIYPLIYLLLQDDLEIVQLACKHNIYAEEFEKVEDSMFNVFLAFDARRRDLTAIFQQTHGDLGRKFENYAFGMFENSYKLSLSWAISDSDLQTVWKKFPQESDDGVDENISTDVLKSGVRQPPDFPPPYQFVNEDYDNEFGTIEGLWAGYCTWKDTDASMMSCLGPLIRLNLKKSTGSTTFSGEALFSDKADPVDVRGCLNDAQGTTYGNTLSLELGWIKCSGTLNETCTKITGDWRTSSGTRIVNLRKTDLGRDGNLRLRLFDMK